MKNKQQLQELVRHIIRQTLKELTGSSTSLMGTSGQMSRTSNLNDPNQAPMDAMTPLEQRKQEREQERMRRDALKQGQAEEDSIKADKKKYETNLKQIRRFKEPMIRKKIQALKGGQVSTGAGM